MPWTLAANALADLAPYPILRRHAVVITTSGWLRSVSPRLNAAADAAVFCRYAPGAWHVLSCARHTAPYEPLAA